MSEKQEKKGKVIVVPLPKPRRELADWEIDLLPNYSLLDPYKNLIPEKL